MVMMEEYDDENMMFDDSVSEDFSHREEDDEEDPKASAFMRGVREAQEIKESSNDVEDDENDFLI